MAGLATLLYAAVTYVLFLATFVYAVGFVGNLWVPKAIDTGAGPFTLGALLVNLAVLGVFAVQHSVMARPAFKRAWTRIVPPAAERSTYVLLATAALALVLWQWRPIAGTVWSVRDPFLAGALQALFFAGWAVLLAATFMINHFDLFGLNQAWLRFRNLPSPPLEFQVRGLYRFVRHPIMLGFLIAFWATPEMTVGHLLFALGTTGYILIGVALEERDLLAHFGERYRSYRTAVPMLVPGLGRSRAAKRSTQSGAGA